MKEVSNNSSNILNKYEKKLKEEIESYQKKIKDVQTEGQSRVHEIEDFYEKSILNEKIKSENYLEEEKNKNYEKIAELKKRNDKSFQETKNQNDFDLNNLKKYYLYEKYRLKQAGDDDINQINSENAQLIQKLKNENILDRDFVSESMNNELLSEIKKNEHSFLEVKKKYNNELNKIHSDSNHEIENLKNKSNESIVKFKENEINKIEKIDKDFNLLKNKIINQAQINLDSYNNKSKDSFFSVINLNPQWLKDNNYYYLKIDAPNYLHDNLRISIQNNEIIILGNRESDQSIIDQDSEKRTFSAQSFQQKIKIPVLIDEKSAKKVIASESEVRWYFNAKN